MVKGTRLGIAKVACTVGLAAALGVSGLPLAAVPAWAGTVTVTSSEHNAGVTYQVYQLLTGTVRKADAAEGESEDVLTEVGWAPGAMDAFEAAVAASTPENGTAESWGTTAQDAADYIAGQLADSDERTIVDPTSFAGQLAAAVEDGGLKPTTITAGTKSVNLSDGYYLILSNKDSLTGNTTATAPVFALVGAGDLTITEKTSVPTVTKEVQEDSDGEWGHYADAQIGQTIKYRLTATLPTDYANYSKYVLKFVDYLSKGLTYDSGSAEVWVVHEDGTKDEVTDKFNTGTSDQDNPDTDAEDAVFDSGQKALVFNGGDIKTVTLGKSGSIVASDKILVEYTAKLNESAVVGSEGNPNKAKLVYSNNPHSENSTGTTQIVDPVVYTYQLQLTKKDFDKRGASTSDNGLEGAKFTIQLTKADGATDKDSAGKYVQEHGDLGDDPYEFTTGEGGTFSVSGLDAGTYTITETIAPAGYSTLDASSPITIKSDLDEDKKLTLDVTGGDSYVTVEEPSDESSGVVNVTVRDVKNVGMPQTGSTGFVAMIAGGAALVVASLAALLGRKKAGKRP